MTTVQFLAGSALALGLATASTAAAHGVGDFVCQTSNMAKTAPPTTHCLTWTHEAKAMMQTAPCDPAKMSVDAMRRRCAEMSAGSSPAAPPAHG